MAKRTRTPPDAGLALIARYEAAVIEAGWSVCTAPAWTRPTWRANVRPSRRSPPRLASGCGPTTARGHSHERRACGTRSAFEEAHAAAPGAHPRD